MDIKRASSHGLALVVGILLLVILIPGCNEVQRYDSIIYLHRGSSGILDRCATDIVTGEYTILRADTTGIHKHLTSNIPGWIPPDDSYYVEGNSAFILESPYYLGSYMAGSSHIVVYYYHSSYQIHVVNTKGDSRKVFDSHSDMGTTAYGSAWPLLCADDKFLYLLMWPKTIWKHEEPGRPLDALYRLNLDSLADSEPAIEVVWNDAGKWMTRNDKPDCRYNDISACKLAVHHGSFYLFSYRSDDRENPNQGYNQGS